MLVAHIRFRTTQTPKRPISQPLSQPNHPSLSYGPNSCLKRCTNADKNCLAFLASCSPPRLLRQLQLGLLLASEWRDNQRRSAIFNTFRQDTYNILFAAFTALYSTLRHLLPSAVASFFIAPMFELQFFVFSLFFLLFFLALFCLPY